jgi:hypothetical protein
MKQYTKGLKTQGNWVVEIGVRVPKIEDAGNICLKRPRPIQGCRSDDDNDEVDDDDDDEPWEILVKC